MPHTTPSFILTDGAGLDEHADTSDLVVLSLSRREVEAGRVGDAVDRLMSLSDRADRVRRFEGMLLLEFAGWDEDPREVAAIPQCRSFFHALTAQWPYWMHFLSKGQWQDVEQITLALALLVPVQVLPSENGINRIQLDPNDIARTTLRLFSAMNSLHALHGIGIEDNRLISDRIVAVLEKAYT